MGSTGRRSVLYQIGCTKSTIARSPRLAFINEAPNERLLGAFLPLLFRDPSPLEGVGILFEPVIARLSSPTPEALQDLFVVDLVRAENPNAWKSAWMLLSVVEILRVGGWAEMTSVRVLMGCV